MIEVKINWRCNNVIWWAALIEDETMAAQLSCPTLSRRRRTFCPRPEVWGLPLAVKNRRPTAQGKAPPVTLENIAWILSPDSRKKRIGNKHCHGFWGKMECGLSSVSPWEYVPKEAGIKRAGGKL